MDRRLALVIALALAALAAEGRAQSYQTQAQPPAGWGGSAGAWTFRQAANAAQWVSGSAATNVVVDVGGKAVTVPARMRLAANAPSIIARAALSSPVSRLLPVIGWAATALWLWDAVNSRWTAQDFAGGVYFQGASGGQSCRSTAPDSALGFCTLSAANGTGLIDSVVVTGGPSNYTVTGRYTPNGNILTSSISRVTCNSPYVYNPSTKACVPQSYHVATQADADAAAATYPMADDVPQAVDEHMALPMATPEVITTTVALAEPEPVPGAAPDAAWRQMVATITGAGTSDVPWEVTVDPHYIAADNPGTAPIEGTVPPAQPGETDQPNPCEQNPQASGCKPLGDVDAGPDVQPDARTAVIEPVGDFGPATAACPAPRQVTLAHGFTVSMPFTLLCDLADGLRPVILGVAWLAAIFAFVGIGRRAD